MAVVVGRRGNGEGGGVLEGEGGRERGGRGQMLGFRAVRFVFRLLTWAWTPPAVGPRYEGTEVRGPTGPGRSRGRGECYVT